MVNTGTKLDALWENRTRQFFIPTHKENISDKMTLKEKLLWGFYAWNGYSAERQQLVIGGFLKRKP